MDPVAISVNQIAIRLTNERWQHIVSEHPEVEIYRVEILKTISDPERVLHGGEGELLAQREVEAGKWLIVVYREMGDDGFIITAFVTRRRRSLDKRTVIWSR